MIVTTKQDVIDSVSIRFTEQYPPNTTVGKWAEVGKKLRENKLTEEEINDLIGNKGWTDNSCNECGEDQEKVIIFGDIEDKWAPIFCICESCLDVALELIKE